MADPPPSSICHTLDLGFAPIIQAPSSDGAFFLSATRLDSLQKMHGRRTEPAFVRRARQADIPFRQIAAFLLPCRSAPVAASADDPKAPLIPSSGVFHFGAVD